jgi:Domain of unknown function (DUF5668)
MSRYLIVCRLRWPALLLLTGVLALLDQMDILSWGRSWPLYLILLGLLALAERAAMATEPPSPAYPYAAGYPAAGYAPGYPPPASAYPSPQAPPEAAPPASTGIVPARTELDLRDNDNAKESRKSWEEEGR